MHIMVRYPQIVEMEINPLMVTRRYSYAADIKITLSEE